MADANWKRAERRICRAFGGERSGPDGVGHSDCKGTAQAVQVKRSSRGCPLTKWIHTAKLHGRKEGKPWVLVVVQPGQHLSNATATVSLGYLLSLLGSPDANSLDTYIDSEYNPPSPQPSGGGT